MKKRIFSFLLVFCFVIPCMFILSGCSKDKEDSDLVPKFCLLQQGQTLNVGTSNKFTNSQYTTTENYYLEYVKSATATLYIKSSIYETGPTFYYNGQHYCWSIRDENTENLLLGNKIETITTTYEYLTYGENKNVIIRKTIKTDTSYDFSMGEYEKPCQITYNLGGFFESIQDLKEKAPHIYEGLIVSKNNKYYIEEPKTTYSYSENDYQNTYFYFN